MSLDIIFHYLNLFSTLLYIYQFARSSFSGDAYKETSVAMWENQKSIMGHPGQLAIVQIVATVYSKIEMMSCRRIYCIINQYFNLLSIFSIKIYYSNFSIKNLLYHRRFSYLCFLKFKRVIQW